jgi:hypothetical protein
VARRMRHFGSIVSPESERVCLCTTYEVVEMR